MLGDNDCPDCLDQSRGYCEAHIPVEYLCDKLGICEDCLLSRDHWIDCEEELCKNGVENITNIDFIAALEKMIRTLK